MRDASQEPDWRDFAGVARTLACVPLQGDGEILGTVTIFDKFPHKTFFPSSFTTEDLATFGKFLKYAEKAVVNAIAYERNDRLKNLDETTSLPTLKYFQERLLHEISRAKRFQRRLVLMICEVQAHVPAGSRPRAGRADWVMKRVAKAIRASLREYDVVARISEAKFGMILPEAEDGKISAIPASRRRSPPRPRRSAPREDARVESGSATLVPGGRRRPREADLQVEHPEDVTAGRAAAGYVRRRGERRDPPWRAPVARRRSRIDDPPWLPSRRATTWSSGDGDPRERRTGACRIRRAGGKPQAGRAKLSAVAERQTLIVTRGAAARDLAVISPPHAIPRRAQPVTGGLPAEAAAYTGLGGPASSGSPSFIEPVRYPLRSTET